MNEENIEVTDEVVTEEINDNDVVDNEEEREFSEDSDTSKEEEEKTQSKMYTEEETEKIAKQRETRAWKKATREKNEELKDYTEIIDTLKAGMNLESIDEIKKSLKNFYSEQGIEIPERKGLTEREEKILAEADAKEIIELGEDEVNKVANEIYNKPLEKRTTREKVIFEKLGNYVMEEKAKKSLVDKGIDTSILDDKKFKSFASKFNANTDLSDIYEMYNTLNTPKEKVERPKSTGSVKTVASTNEIKEFYTPEEVSKFSMKDLDNPTLMKAIENSMRKW